MAGVKLEGTNPNIEIEFFDIKDGNESWRRYEIRKNHKRTIEMSVMESDVTIIQVSSDSEEYFRDSLKKELETQGVKRIEFGGSSKPKFTLRTTRENNAEVMMQAISALAQNDDINPQDANVMVANELAARNIPASATNHLLSFGDEASLEDRDISVYHRITQGLNKPEMLAITQYPYSKVMQVEQMIDRDDMDKQIILGTEETLLIFRDERSGTEALKKIKEKGFSARAKPDEPTIIKVEDSVANLMHALPEIGLMPKFIADEIATRSLAPYEQARNWQRTAPPVGAGREPGK